MTTASTLEIDDDLTPRRRANRGAGIRAGLVLVPLILAVGGLVARISGSTEDNGWFQSLVLPPVQPPGAAFGIAWSILYTVLAVAAAIIWAQPAGALRTRALWLFAIGMLINFTWSPVFFSAHLIVPALAIILVMWAVAVWTTVVFAKLSRLAAAMMLPYIAWLTFAALLNAWIWRLNPGADAFQLGV
ncbi:TspO/MBR family protein [Polymorphobacter sp.]|uniref:TspO/MBR family protein n=1 Tax=Polymorphobacter sp. TaxID=1909290 RepID=UPI003F7102EA